MYTHVYAQMCTNTDAHVCGHDACMHVRNETRLPTHAMAVFAEVPAGSAKLLLHACLSDPAGGQAAGPVLIQTSPFMCLFALMLKLMCLLLIHCSQERVHVCVCVCVCVCVLICVHMNT